MRAGMAMVAGALVIGIGSVSTSWPAILVGAVLLLIGIFLLPAIK
jgi:hypothetical protein